MYFLSGAGPVLGDYIVSPMKGVCMDFGSLARSLSTGSLPRVCSVSYSSISFFPGTMPFLSRWQSARFPGGSVPKVLFFGSLVAIVLRIILTFFAAQLLMVSFIKLIGGLLVSWIAVKLFTEDPEDSDSKRGDYFCPGVAYYRYCRSGHESGQCTCCCCGFTGKLFIFSCSDCSRHPAGGGTSTLFSSLMDRYPIIIYVGAAILGKVAVKCHYGSVCRFLVQSGQIDDIFNTGNIHGGCGCRRKAHASRVSMPQCRKKSTPSGQTKRTCVAIITVSRQMEAAEERSTDHCRTGRTGVFRQGKDLANIQKVGGHGLPGKKRWTRSARASGALLTVICRACCPCRKGDP